MATPEEKKDPLTESLAQVDQIKAKRIQHAVADQTEAEIRFNTTKTKAEEAVLQSQMPGMNITGSPTPGPYPPGYMPIPGYPGYQIPGMQPSVNQMLMDILTLGNQRGIDVSPAISAILNQQKAPGAPADVQPKWMDKVMEAVATKVLLNETKTDPRVDALQEKIHGLEGTLKDQFGNLKSLIEKLSSTPPVDPQQAMLNQLTFQVKLKEAMDKVSPPPPVVAPGGKNEELTFKTQDRFWQHEEHKEKMEVERAKINAEIQMATQKIESRNESLAMLPQMIGGVIVSALTERGEGKEKDLTPRRGAPPAEQFTLRIEKSETTPHGPITIKCPTCRNELTLVTSAKTCQCASCGAEHLIKIVPPQSAAPAPAAPPVEESGEAPMGRVQSL